MNFASLLRLAQSLYHQYPFVVAAVTLVLLFIIYKKPKASFKFSLLLLFMAAVFYAIGLFSEVVSTGSQSKDRMIYKSKGLDD